MSDRPKERLTAYALLAGGMAVFGSGTPVSKVVTEAFPAFLASELRMLAGLVPLVVVLVALDGHRDLRQAGRRDRLLLGAIALFGMVGFSVAMLYGMREIPGAVGGIVMATTPAVTALGSVLFLRDRLDRLTAFGIALAVGGVAAVNVAGVSGLESGDSLILGTLLVFGAVCGEAAYTLLGKRLGADLTPISIAAAATAIAALLFAPLAAIDLGDFDWGSPALSDWLAVVWWGVGTLALGTWLWYSGIQRVEGSTAAGFMGVMPISAIVLSYVLLGESPEPLHAVGGAAVLAAIAAVTVADRRRSEADAAD